MTDPDSPLQKLVSAWVARRPSCLRGAPAGSQGARARNPSDRDGTRGGWGMETRSAGPGGFRALIPRHPARVGEIMQVRWFDYYGAMLFGDRHEIACIPHGGCYLEILGTGETSHREVNLLLPGHVIRYTRSFLFGDRFELPSGARVGLCISWASNCSWHHVRPLPHQSRRSLPGGGADANRIVSPRQNLPALLFGEGSGCGRPPGRRPLFHLSGRAYVDPAGAQNPLVRSRHYCSGRTLYGPPHSGCPSNRRRPPACERVVGGAARPGDTRGPPQAGIRRSRQKCSAGPAAFAGTRGRSVDPTTLLTPLRGYRSRVPTRSLPTSGSTTSRSSARTPG